MDLSVLEGWLNQLGASGAELLLQVGVFVLLVVVARGLVRFPRKGLGRLRGWLATRSLTAEVPLLLDLIELLEQVLWPLLAWLLGMVAVALFRQSELEWAVLAWLVPFLALWLGYRFLTALLAMRLAPATARIWRRKLIRPLTLALAILLAIGFLDEVWAFGGRFSANRITFGTLLAGGLVFLVAYLLSNSSRRVVGNIVLPRAGFDPTLTQVLASFVAYAVLLTGLLVAIGVMGFDLTTFALIAGGLSVGFGFGMQDVISNFISGFILLFERSISPGDVIRVEGNLGTVQEVGIRSMRIRTPDNVELIVPNTLLLTSVVTNYTRGDRRVRLRVPVGVSYGSEPREVERALLEAAAGAGLTLTSPAPAVAFVGFGDSSLVFELRLWLDDAVRVPEVESALRYHIWDAFAAHAIEMPFPQRDIHIRSMPSATDDS